MAFNEFPKTFYRYGTEGEREGRTFNAPEDVEAGWLTWEAFDALPKPKPKAQPAPVPQSAVEAGKRLATAEEKVDRLTDTVKLYEDFMARLRDDPGCPDELRAELVALIGEAKPAEEAPAEPAKPKRRKA